MIAIPAPETLTSAVFSIEGDPNAPQFRGLHNERARWNGWAQPLFTREVVEQVIAMTQAEDGADYYGFAWDGAVLVVTDRCDAEPYTWRQEPYVLDGVLLYDCGFGWVWDTVEEGC